MTQQRSDHPARRRLLQGAAALGLAFASLATVAQTYPTKVIRMIVPYPPGGPTDVLARIVAARLGDKLGQTVIIENKPGASGMIGADMVAKAAPDGYTLLVNASIHVINPALYAKPKYDAIADFAPIGQLADVPLVLVVNNALPVHSVKELIAYGKSGKKPLNFASSGNAAAPHLAGEAFKIAAGIDMLHVPYKGSGPALSDLIGGQVDLMFDSLPSSLQFVKSNTLRGIAVTTTKRSAALPDLPTVAEAGLPGYSISTWYGMYAPAGTPKAVVDKLSSEVATIVKSAEVKKQFADLGAEPVGSTPEDFAAFNKAELVKWAGVVKQAGVKLD